MSPFGSSCFKVKIYVLKKCGSEISVILDPNVWSSQSDSCHSKLVLGLALGLHLMTNLKASWNKQIRLFIAFNVSTHSIEFIKLPDFKINCRKDWLASIVCLRRCIRKAVVTAVQRLRPCLEIIRTREPKSRCHAAKKKKVLWVSAKTEGKVKEWSEFIKVNLMYKWSFLKLALLKGKCHAILSQELSDC